MSQEIHNGLQPLAISAAELATLLHVSLRHIRRMDSMGRLPKPIRLGYSVRWRVDELHAWLSVGAPDRKTWAAMKNAR